MIRISALLGFNYSDLFGLNLRLAFCFIIKEADVGRLQGKGVSATSGTVISRGAGPGDADRGLHSSLEAEPSC